LPPTISLEESDMKYQNVTACCRRVAPSTTSSAVSDNEKDAETCAASTTESSNDASSYVAADHSSTTRTTTTTSTTTALEPFVLGRMPQFTTAQAYAVLQEARAAWNGGAGVWTQMTLKGRCAALRKFFSLLQQPPTRQAIVTTLMHEIGKHRRDAENELDRTIAFAEQVLQVVETDPDYTGQWQTIGSTTRAMVRRAALGIVLALAPYNYPLNECYAAIIPALLLGNIVIVKIPTVGGLVHLLTLPAWEQALPPGTIHFIAGSGRSTMPQLMETGAIDALAFIGGVYVDCFVACTVACRLSSCVCQYSYNFICTLSFFLSGKYNRFQSSGSIDFQSSSSAPTQSVLAARSE
jgi:acyl-CoA reductase-like NAD-dependent aldehyde dehydrogenase